MHSKEQNLPDLREDNFEKAILGCQRTSGSDLSEMLVQLSGRYITENYEELMKLCLRTVKDKEQAIEVLNAVVYFRLPGLMSRWNPEKGRFAAFAGYSLVLYIWKYRQRKYEIQAKAPSFSSSHKDLVIEEEIGNRNTSDPLEHVANKEIISIGLARLEDYSRWLVVARIVDGLSFDEMAEKLGVSKGTAFNHYSKAFIQFRKILRELSC